MPTETWWNLPDSKRRKVMQAAMAEFGARGFSAGSLNVIARDAGIAKGSLFQYFKDKLDLFSTMSEAVATNIQDAALDAVDLENAPYFDCVRAIVANWLRYFRTRPLERSMAFAAANEIDPDARGAVRSVSNAHYLGVFRPLAKRAKDRGEFRAGTDIDHVVALTIMLLRHLDSAPFQAHIDPVLGLYEKSARQVDRIARELVGALEHGFAA